MKHPLTSFFYPGMKLLFFALLALVFIAVSALGEPADDPAVAEYSRFLCALPIHATTSLPAALKACQTYADKASSQDAKDQLFRRYRIFFRLVQDAIRDELAISVSLDRVVEKSDSGRYYRIRDSKEFTEDALETAASKLSENGFAAYATENGYALVEDPFFLKETFSGIVSDKLMIFLKARSAELSVGPAMTDAGYAIGWDALSERLVAWEGVKNSLSGMTEGLEAAKKADDYFKMYLMDYGLPDSPMFKEGKLVDSLRKSYETFLRNHPDSAYYSRINDYLTILKKADFALSEDAKTFLSKNDLALKRTPEGPQVIAQTPYYALNPTDITALRLVMPSGEVSEDTDSGPLPEMKYEGSFMLQALNGSGGVVAAANLGGLFSEPLAFKSFTLRLEDYNSDGFPDLSLGQRLNSNHFSFAVFTLNASGTKLTVLRINGNPLFSSAVREYSKAFEKTDAETFHAVYYDNSSGKSFSASYKWDGKAFVLGRTEEMPAAE